MHVREKVGKSCDSLHFFKWFVAPEGRKVTSPKQRVRSHLARWEMKSCTPLWREPRFQVKMHKARQLRGNFRSCDVEKVHAVVARSTFPSKKNTKHTMFGPLLEVEMSKKCTWLWAVAYCYGQKYQPSVDYLQNLAANSLWRDSELKPLPCLSGAPNAANFHGPLVLHPAVLSSLAPAMPLRAIFGGNRNNWSKTLKVFRVNSTTVEWYRMETIVLHTQLWFNICWDTWMMSNSIRCTQGSWSIFRSKNVQNTRGSDH